MGGLVGSPHRRLNVSSGRSNNAEVNTVAFAVVTWFCRTV